MRIAALQIDVSQNKRENIDKIEQVITSLSDKKIDMVILPEMFLCPYQTHLFEEYSEVEGGVTWQRLSHTAKTNNVYLVAGSVPEYKDGQIYNTSYVFDRNGKQIAKHRKIHLFDIDVENGQSFKESDVLSVGYEPTVFTTEFGKFGLCICYDFRFPELSRIMVDKGAEAIIVPAAFNMTTGPSHWDILFRTRALDNQLFTLGVAPARNSATGYTSWGHSIVVSPWGEIIDQLKQFEDILLVDLDFALVSQVRTELPLLAHRRHDVYSIESPVALKK
ncbi:carbon-nitrogen hydrolase family protein [Fusibacter sp. JL216-2]|uniref:carbon-nitrogen hydrolase family protein n=1 Tax=Fusibacter sp. JL216-2 TaxID=3071453 RepID=UPI003D34ECD1